MATVSELLHDVVFEPSVVAGHMGLGRDVQRVVSSPEPGRLTVAAGRSDVYVYATSGCDANTRDLSAHALLDVLMSGIGAVVVDDAPSAAVRAAADDTATPVVLVPQDACRGLVETLDRALSRHAAMLPERKSALHADFSTFVRLGATRAQVLERLVEATSKIGLLQARNSLAELVRWPGRVWLTGKTLQEAISASDADAIHWMRAGAEATGGDIVYIEQPDYGLVRLVAPVWNDGWIHAAVSLFGRPAEISSDDRVALAIAARVLSEVRVDDHVPVPARSVPSETASVAAVMLRADDSQTDDLVRLVDEESNSTPVGVTRGPDGVQVWFAYETPAGSRLQLERLHTRLTRSLGCVSIGYALCRRYEAHHGTIAMMHAAEALSIGDRLFGPGNITGYADAQIARLLLENSNPAELRALYERAAGKLTHEDHGRELGLMCTLESYCETVGMQPTAQRLGIHRNTVLHRIKRIEELTSVDLDDSSTRLLFQLALLADRLLRTAANAHPVSNPLRRRTGACLT